MKKFIVNTLIAGLLTVKVFSLETGQEVMAGLVLNGMSQHEITDWPLWPDTDYNIAVTCVDIPGPKEEMLNNIPLTDGALGLPAAIYILQIQAGIRE